METLPAVIDPTLSERQRRAIAYVQEFGWPERGITGLCEAIGVSRQAFYEWRTQPAFQWAWLEVAPMIARDALPDVTNAMILKARQGDVRAARLIYELTGSLVHRSQTETRVIVEVVET